MVFTFDFIQGVPDSAKKVLVCGENRTIKGELNDRLHAIYRIDLPLILCVSQLRFGYAVANLTTL